MTRIDASQLDENRRRSKAPRPIRSIQTTIQTFSADIEAIKQFYSVSFSATRLERVGTHAKQALDELSAVFHFDELDQSEKVDYLVFRSYLTRLLDENKTEADKFHQAQQAGLLGSWTAGCLSFVETRHVVGKASGRSIATTFQRAADDVQLLVDDLPSRQGKDVFIMTWTATKADELQEALKEAVKFYQGYDPVISWWIAAPWKTLQSKLQALIAGLGEVTGTAGSGSADDIVGQPVGRKGILRDLEAEWIAYSPEELIELGEKEFEWCEKELELASKALGFDDPKVALEHVRNTFVEPGEQTHVVRDLATEAIAYVEKHDLITVPQVAKECWQTTMMSPERQKINPFFLGGERIIVSYPTNDMCHEDKLMSMRGNNPPFSRSTVHHELIPGHHLQFYYMDRFRTYRKLFETPFWIEGWAVYWELILWERGFPAEIGQKWTKNEAENRIGMLFWRMHRCARIIFSIKFHLGQMTPKECIDLLVERVGHERATAEGEVRRSFAGDYPPLYQAGYLLGALQIRRLRQELVDDPRGPRWNEKEFHDAILRESTLPIEILRALFRGERLTLERTPRWRFYD